MSDLLRFPALSSLRRLAGALALLAGLSGCSSVYTVKVDAIRTPEIAPRRTYHLVPARPETDVSEPAYAEAKKLVDRALELNGLFAASRPEWADILVEIDFEVGPRRLVSVPDTAAQDSGAVAVFVPEREGVPLTESSGTYLPTAALTRVVPVWEKRMSLVACENLIGTGRVQQSGAELWRADVSIQDGSSEIEALLPILAAALVDTIDRDAGPSSVRRISQSGTIVTLVTQRD